MTMTSLALPNTGIFEIRTDGLRRLPRTFWAFGLLVLAVLAGYTLRLALQTPGEAIRGELLAAADELLEPPAQEPTQAALHAIERHFPSQAVSLDSTRWPRVAVTLHNVDRTTCLEAASLAGRIEGLVVVELDNLASGAGCQDANEMTWWLLP
jgi:hypothetical protein